MRTIVLLSLVLISAPTFACKPDPLASCEGEKSIVLKVEAAKQLQDKLAEFHKVLDESLIPNFKGTSCFNNRIADGYISGLKEPFTCSKQLTQVETSVGQALSPDSETWRAIRSDEAKAKLETPAAEVKSILKFFLKEHSN
jgi:hypothetical protein